MGNKFMVFATFNPSYQIAYCSKVHSYISGLSRAKASGYQTYFTLKNCMHSSVKIQEDRTFDQWVIIGDEEYAMYAGVCTDLYSLLLTLTPGTENDDYIDFDMMFFDISEYTVK